MFARSHEFARRPPSTAFITLLGLAFASPADAQSIGDYQGIVDAYVTERGDAEGISGVSVYVSLGDPGPAIELFAGVTEREGVVPVTGNTLFQIGSNTKAFTAALLLALEAEGQLDIDQTVGDWLPLYPAWGDVTIRRLLNMTSGIPNYTESPAWMRLAAEDPDRHYTPADLIDFAYPSPTVDLPPNDGWFYSNTNYILAGMIAEKAAGVPYAEALRQRLLVPVGLNETFYEPTSYPVEVTDRLASGYFEDTACSFYEPDCEESASAALLGQDVRLADVSWAGAAGGMISTPRDLARWIRALFAGKVLPPEQLEEMLSLVSEDTGEPIPQASTEAAKGFSLGLVQTFRPEVGRLWFYQGETQGYRFAFLFSLETDVLVVGATNSHPVAEEDQFVPVLVKLYALATQ